MRVKLKPAWRVAASDTRVYHTEDCQYVGKAKEGVFKHRDLEEVPDDVKECNACKGEFPERDGYNQQLNDLLKHTNPEDLGMPEIGER